eukprot:c6033_g1_i1.p1 GENE.c6033_g1_i1~~c6033_g1_i1.p1  ORF type:complete len:185 (+),score=37.46 c6033_g1_i1:40-555(+)
MSTPDILQQWFLAVDADRSGQIEPKELQAALNNQRRFALSTVRLMIKMFDRSGEGKINFEEFCALWKYLGDWQNAFNQFDRDRSGTIEGAELAFALKTQGFDFSQDVYDAVIKSFAPSGKVQFDQFIEINVLLGWIRNAFIRLDANHTAQVTLDYAAFIKLIMQFHLPELN